MMPFNEMTQLERKATVARLLQQDNLTEWARNYWSLVFDTIAMNEQRYNARNFANNG
jgi:hypothetical protein